MKRRAVSEVIGTLILVGVVMVGITLVGIFLLSNPAPSKVPVFDSIISNQSKTIYIYHKGGDPLYRGQYSILVDGGDQTANFTIMSPGTEPWAVGETLTNITPNMPKHVVIVFNQGGGGGTILAAEDLIGSRTVPAPSTVMWYNYSTTGKCLWTYRESITIDGTKVPATLYNFPVLLNLTDSNLQSKAQASGNDILFTDSTGTTKIPHEIESYASGTGALIAWAQVPTLNSGTNTVIYMYYGNSTVGSQQNVTGVWDSNFVMVQHMNGASSAALKDSTGNHNDVTSQVGSPGYLQPGQIGSAVSFGGSAAVEIMSSASLNVTSQVTVCAWIQPTAIGMWNRIAAKSFSSNNPPYTEYGLLFNDSQRVRGEIASGGVQYVSNGTSVIPTGTWTYACMNYDHSAFSVFVNGSLENQKSLSTNIDKDAMPLSIARSGFGIDYFTGTIDEVRISNIARPPQWIATEYANQNSPSTFSTVGSEEQWWKC